MSQLDSDQSGTASDTDFGLGGFTDGEPHKTRGMNTRKPLSRRLRFEIFKRDGFRCTYCGATPVTSPLHVDHVVAVANGGTDEPSNLVTSCGSCNHGKSAVPLEKKALAVGKLTEADLDHAQQIREYLAVQRDVGKARDELAEMLEEAWEERCGSLPKGARTRFLKMVEEFGVARLLSAFDAVADRNLRWADQIKYLYGVLKRMREDARAQAKPEAPPTVDLPDSVCDGLPIEQVCKALYALTLLVHESEYDWVDATDPTWGDPAAKGPFDYKEQFLRIVAANRWFWNWIDHSAPYPAQVVRKILEHDEDD